jgi:hypothetical protein
MTRVGRDCPGYTLRWINPDRVPAAPFNRLERFHNRGQVGDWNDPVQSELASSTL